jgi:transcription elongation factor GreA
VHSRDDLDTGARLENQLVGSLESDPETGRLSAESPLGRALIGRRKGEVALCEAPKGRLQFKILAVEPPAAAA